MKTKPKNKRGLAAVKRLGRNYKTGNFQKIVDALMKKGYSEEQAKKIAGKIYWSKVREYRNKR